MWKKIRIRKHEAGLWFRRGDFKQVLAPGTHRVIRSLPLVGKSEVEIVNTLEAKLEHDLLKLIAAAPGMDERLVTLDLGDKERALVWIDGRLGWIVGPGLHAFWRSTRKIEVERYSTDEYRFEHPKIEAVLAHTSASKYLDGIRVESHERVLLYREGELFDQLRPGIYLFWKNAGKTTWKAVDLREQVADVAGQEIMTADKVTLRVNLVVTYRVLDPLKAISEVGDYAQALYREAQLALREAVGGRQLDKLLADKDEVGAEVRNKLASRVTEFGVNVRSIGLRDIILPGDMKVILNEVILAQKQAEANLIRRREETAAARSQANTAKLLAENPALARMKELEALQAILSGAKATFVLGKGDLSEQVRSLLGPVAPTGEGPGEN